jgi:ubiquitin-protein ligase
MLNEHQFNERVAIESNLLSKEFPTFKPVNGDLTHWCGFIMGTGLYRDGVFVIEIKIPREFPFEPPKIEWKTRIWHPNFKDEEIPRICLSILNRDWSPNVHITGILQAISDLLANPNPLDPFNSAAAKQYLDNRSKFLNMVDKYLKNYAGWDKLRAR